ncbi:DUF1993 domain-containing protein [Solimonas marina]|uniref:DUF1993 domain-containing protein n=1 Tax=Solimonas marina TaxID=2714601 RepID=A0A969WBY4_9GAMM|nr:DUF1993 domain-containing protein [Solimonas marina]NKF23374.1 DUF1993 domain-containing protein [Solimonas marina]
MTISLFDATVPNYLQILDASIHVLERGQQHCTEHGIDLQGIVETRLFDDMLPFRFQIHSIAHHSGGALDALQNGLFEPPARRSGDDYAALQALLVTTRDRIAGLSPADVNARSGAEVVFRVGEFQRSFTAENFVMSFSMPNFHFHAATAYDILRMKGVPLGKRDFMGRMRAQK